MARTIDNLGISASNQYAEQQEEQEQSFIKDSQTVSSHATINTNSPFSAPKFYDLFTPSINWGKTCPPEGFFVSRKLLFSNQLTPSLDLQKAEHCLERLKNSQKDPDSDKEFPDSKESHKEREVLIKFFKKVTELNKWIIEINSRCGQYKKG